MGVGRAGVAGGVSTLGKGVLHRYGRVRDRQVPRPIFDMDFFKRQSLPADFTFNTLVAGATERDGLTFVGSNTPRIGGLGLLCEDESTNKCANTNVAPINTSGTTPDANWTTWRRVARADLPAAVLDGLNAIDPEGTVRGVYHGISNGAGPVSFDGPCGNLNQHTVSCWLYVVSGTGRVTLPGQSVPPVPNGVWVRGTNTLTPGLTAHVLQITTSTVTELYAFGNQLEEQAARTSLIQVAGSAATRLGDNVSVPMPPNFDIARYVAVVEFSAYLLRDGAGFCRVLRLDRNTNAGGQRISSSIVHTTNFQQLIDGLVTINGPAYTVDTVGRHAFGASGTTLRYAVDGTYVGATAYTPPSNYLTMRFGCQLGEDHELQGYVRRVSLYDMEPTPDTLELLSGGWA